MKPEQQIKALAELDGLVGRFQNIQHVLVKGVWHPVPPYLTSYDAIIPLIQKQTDEVGWLLANHLKDIITEDRFVWQATPTQLCEALLRATGKWIE